MLVTEPLDNLIFVVSEASSAGVDVVQWRDRTGEPKLQQETAQSLRRVMGTRSQLAVNICAPESTMIDSDWLHLPEAAIHEPKSIVHSNRVVGCSVHTVESAIAAESAGMSYIVAGTVFPSQSHPGAPGCGLPFLTQIVSSVKIPVIAIGGISPENAKMCMEAGASGVAVLSGITRAKDIVRSVKLYRCALDA